MIITKKVSSVTCHQDIDDIARSTGTEKIGNFLAQCILIYGVR